MGNKRPATKEETELFLVAFIFGVSVTALAAIVGYAMEAIL